MLKPRVIWTIIGLVVAGTAMTFCGLGAVNILWGPSKYSGYSEGLFESNDWDKESIEKFINRPLPLDAAQFIIEGSKGVLGSYGIIPRLRFSFHASPESARKFAYSFCDGILHPGYNPLVAVDSYPPTEATILIRGWFLFEYSISPGVPDTILGNRCARLDERRGKADFEYGYTSWTEDIVLDTSNTSDYVVTYRLPYDVNSTYPPRHGRYVRPLGDLLRLSVTGLRNMGTEEQPVYVTEYRVICLETAGVAPYGMDHYEWNEEMLTRMSEFENALVDIFIDNQAQPQAYIIRGGLRTHRYRPDGTLNNIPALWEYCLDTSQWEAGSHTMRLVVTAPDKESETFEFTFTIEP